MKNCNFTFILLLLSVFLMPVYGQFGSFGKKILDKTADNLENRIENEVSDRIANEIASRAMKPVNAVLDSIFKAEKVDWEKMGKSMEEFATEMDRTADLPDAYKFDMVLDVEMKDYDKTKHKMKMYLSKTKSIFAMQTPDDGDQKDDIIVMDFEKGLTGMYRVVDGKKEVSAIPNLTEFGLAIATSAIDEEDLADFTFEKTGKTKKIHGYQCDEYIGKNDNEETKGYIAHDFPVNMMSVFGDAGKQFMPTNVLNIVEEMKGFTMKSESKYENGKKSSFEVKKIDEGGYTLSTSDYKKTPLVN